MRGRAFTIAALALGCAQPEDAFVGVYAGTYECSGAYDTGTPYIEGPSPLDVGIERAADGSIYQAGAQCTLPLRVISFTRAEYVTTICRSTLSSGLMVTATWDGVLTLDEPYLRYESDVHVEPDGMPGFVNMHCSFAGARVE